MEHVYRVREKISFYAKEELNRLYQSAKNKHYSEKSDWEKFLDKDRAKASKRNKRIKEHETNLYDTY